jgi:putative FmdB family regulatory protein
VLYYKIEWIFPQQDLEVFAMPVYTYRCESCGVQFEKTQKFSDSALTRCPECGKKELRKVYTPVGIVFKGSGFYSTDNRSPSGQGRLSGSHNEEKSSSSESNTSSPETKKSESTAESKPVEKASVSENK